jgi:16S rRNA (cytidine1402-2'-O)-methyltransferase
MPTAPPPTGTLFIVATPIGNLEDITLRALRVLKEVTLIAAEDTRQTAKLLSHYGIATRTTSLHEHNERTRAAELVDRLLDGESIALVTDAGTPLLSDPGRYLTRASIARGIRVEPVPGASALMAAISGSGAVDQEFTFLGFSPSRSAERRRFYERAATLEGPFITFESPHRLLASLEDALAVLGDRPVILCRELTKVHETFHHTTVSQALTDFRAKDKIGELTLVFPSTEGAIPPRVDAAPLDDEAVWAAVADLSRAGMTRRQAVAAVARRQGRPPGEIYQAAERGKPRSH